MVLEVGIKFSLEDLKDVKLIIKKDDEYIEAILREFRKGLVKVEICGSDELCWTEEDKLDIIDILFR